jgi:hypothetical protein
MLRFKYIFSPKKWKKKWRFSIKLLPLGQKTIDQNIGFSRKTPIFQ